MTPEHVFRRALVVLTALVTAGCGLDVAAPEPEIPIEIKLDFCSNDVPVWFAHQGTGGSNWTVVTPDAAGTFTFGATSRTAVVFVRQNGSDYKTDMIFTSNLDLEGLSGLTCVEESGAKQLNGNVAGLSGDQLGLVGMSFSSVFLTPIQTAFTLTQLADRPLDLIASRVDVSGDQQHASKTVIRRAQNPTSGSTMAAINFDSEGIEPTFFTATVSGIGSEQAFLMNNFFSSLETSHTLTFLDAISNGALPFVAIPASSLVAGDYHDLFVVAATPDGVVRGAEGYFRVPGDKAFTLSSPLAEPTVSVVSTAPHVRMSVNMAGQVEYSTMVTSDFHQQTSFSSVDVSMSVTASFFGGTPIIWDLPMPNMDGLPGWQNSWALKTGVMDWTVTAYLGRPQLIFGAKPNDGELVVFASRSSSVAAAQAFRTAREVRRPRHFSHLR